MSTPRKRIASGDDAGLRKAAVYALGGLDDPRVPPALEQALHDRAPDVRWNAALQLAAAGNIAGFEVLGEMLSPGYLDGFDGISGEGRRNILVEAIRAVGILDARSLASLAAANSARQDPDLRVRQAAIEVLNEWGEK